MPHGDRPGLWTVVGSEPLLVLEAGDRIRSTASAAGFEERTVLTSGGNFDWSRLAAASDSLSLFASRRLVELRIPNGKPGDAGSEAIRRYCERLPNETVTLVSIGTADWSTRKAVWFKALESAGTVVDCTPPGAAELPRWIAGRLAAQQQEADADTLAFLAARFEGNLLAARQELDKLALLFPPGRLDGAAVREAVLDVARYDPQQWVDALLVGDMERAGRVLAGLAAEGASVPSLVWLLADHLQGVWAVSEAGGRVDEGLKRGHRLYGERGQLVERAARRLPLRQVERAMRTLAMAERGGKGLEPQHDVWQIMANVAVALAPERRRAA
ncbi:MAG: DNA polymerase III subunit delta [Rhodocyclaceae bacterium]|nr:DNA polymerase III subunit delta [Rhodocyclaceae bacterium]